MRPLRCAAWDSQSTNSGPEGIERAPNLWSFFFAELPARAMKERIAGREAEAHWTYTENLDRALDRPPASGWQVVESLAARDAMRRRLVEQMRRVPVLLMPVSSIVAFPHRERRFPTETKTDRIVPGDDAGRRLSICSACPRSRFRSAGAKKDCRSAYNWSRGRGRKSCCSSSAPCSKPLAVRGPRRPKIRDLADRPAFVKYRALWGRHACRRAGCPAGLSSLSPRSCQNY